MGSVINSFQYNKYKYFNQYDNQLYFHINVKQHINQYKHVNVKFDKYKYQYELDNDTIINMATNFDNLDAGLAKAIPLSYFPSAQQFYEMTTGQDAETAAWVGGELIYYTPTNKLFVQTATSGTTATWKASAAFATSTSTSTSTTTSSTSTSTSTSTTTSSTSTSTSSSTSSSTTTSTSTSSSTSTSTSTSSTTTP